jgi:hypothetical protein
MSEARAALPDIGAILGPLLARVAADERPLMLALAERLAAERYRGWAARVDDPAVAEGLRRCAAREDEIAARVEAAFADAAAVQARLRAAHPDLPAVADRIFGDRPLAEQWAIQAAGERAGAAAWRALAALRPEDAVRRVFAACAPLEEASAAFLDDLVGAVR